jgi:hypothetical protein
MSEYSTLQVQTQTTGTLILALAFSVKVCTASSGVNLLLKTLILYEMLILVTPLLEHQMSEYSTLQVQTQTTGTLILALATNKQEIALAHIAIHTLQIKRIGNREPRAYQTTRKRCRGTATASDISI